MTTPLLGAPELPTGQNASPETMNEALRWLEQGAGCFRIKDRDLATPPGSPADGDRYIVAGSPTGAWTGHATDIAFYMSTAWTFIDVDEGMFFWFEDENKAFVATSSSTFVELASGSAVTAATATEVRAGTEAGKYVSPDALFDAADYVALTDAATVAVDMSAGINYSLTIGGNRTLGNPTNTKNGQTGAIVITQDGSGNRTLAYGANWEFANGTAPVLSTAIGAKDILFYQVISATSIFANLVKAVA